MFTGQTALDLCSQNQRTLIVSLEMTPARTLARMARQATAQPVPSSDLRRDFLKWTDGRLWLFDYVGRLGPSRCLAVLRYFAKELQGKHVFIDSMMKVVESEESMDEQKAMLGNLCDIAKETGLHVHLIAHCRKPGATGEDKPPTKYDIKGSGAISDQSHNVVLVWDNKPKRAEAGKRNPDPSLNEQPDFLVCIDKQRNGSVEGKFGMMFDERTLRFVDSKDHPVNAYDLGDLL
jgi:twinkle protein